MFLFLRTFRLSVCSLFRVRQRTWSTLNLGVGEILIWWGVAPSSTSFSRRRAALYFLGRVLLDDIRLFHRVPRRIGSYAICRADAM